MRTFFIALLQIYFLVLPLYSIAGENLSVPNGDTRHILAALARLEVPKELINIGKWNEDSFVLLAEKQSQKLYLFDNSYNLIKTFQITTGQNNGNKERVGDKKTPEGVYFFTSVKEDKELLPQYGLIAIPINYPNFFDKLQGKDGNGIWLHATDQPTRPIKPFDTKGCIVAVNEDVLELARYIKLETTPLVIVDKIEFVPLEVMKEEDQEAWEFLNKWRKVWEGKNLRDYMSYYSSDFKSRGMDIKAWRKYKASLNQINSERKISIRGIKILRHADNIIASFIQHYIGEGTNDTGIKRLYIEDTEDGLKIIGEEYTAMPKQDPSKIADRLSEKLPAASNKQQTAKREENTSLQKTSAVNNGANTEKTSKTK
ncbi:MAG: L,D-transpeptidase family protein, partial [Deltaproteobacteria bacterium]|nr:L,D-transpeptidase family protein [Deltaproteobacteria bacterium]